MPVFGAGGIPPVQTRPLWSWDLTTYSQPVATGYPVVSGFSPTKTGLTPTDLQNFVGVPIQFYGDPSVPVPSGVQQQWIRWAEDDVEQQTNILLCQTWIASPPAQVPDAVAALNILVTDPALGQRRGYDYDLEDAGYDFMFNRAQDEGWMAQTMRYRPVQSLSYTPLDYTAVKRTCYIYPLLNDFFTIPPQWNVEDRDYGYVRFVPAQNVQMLPLFAMQLTFMGFAENIPGAIYFQYTAGLTPYDYQSRYSFISQLVLAKAAQRALTTIQGTINLGAEKVRTMVDGLAYETAYPKNGPYGPLIERYAMQEASLLKRAQDMVQGPVMIVL